MNKTLRNYRLKAHLSLSQLAEKAGINERTVSNAEKGDRIQDVKAQQIAEALSQALNIELTIEDLRIETL
jgi:transcriptional regulator with XRE-family HTH domain